MGSSRATPTPACGRSPGSRASGEPLREPADIVVLHRVVCCYPDYERLLGVAAAHAGRQLVFSHPPRNAMARAIVATQNLAFRLMRREFRTFAHAPSAMLSVLAGHGLRAEVAHRGAVWQVAAASR